jgi:uncharacterized protein YggT (Ycf19 family)
MQFNTWDILFNLLGLIFWMRLWLDRDRTLAFNPYLAPLDRAGDAVLTFLAPVFPWLSRRALAGVVLGVIVLFRALVAPTRGQWVLALGLARQVDAAAFSDALTFSALSLAVFLFRLCTLSVVVTLLAGARQGEHPVGALERLAQPFTRLRQEWRLPVLLTAGAVLVVLLDRAGGPPLPPVDRPGVLPVFLDWGRVAAPALLVKVLLVTLAGFAQVLPLLSSMLILLIIGSWISAFTASPGLAWMCRDWIDLLLGPLRRYPLRLGMFDLSPILFFFVLHVIHTVVLVILVAGLRMLP